MHVFVNFSSGSIIDVTTGAKISPTTNLLYEDRDVYLALKDPPLVNCLYLVLAMRYGSYLCYLAHYLQIASRKYGNSRINRVE